DDRAGSDVLGEVHDERRERLRADALEVGDRALDEGHPLVDREQRLVLAHRAVDDGDDDLVIQPRGTPDDVQVPVGDRVIGARAHRYRLLGWGHGWEWIVIVVSPYRRSRSTCMSSCSGVRRSLSTITRAAVASSGASATESSGPQSRA